jgi:hypothetical protein
MATLKQKRAFKEITENHLPVSKAMEKVGYKRVTALKPSNLTESKGFMEIAEKAGLTDEFLTTALYNDIKAKPKNRKPELELAFRVKGRLKEGEKPPPGPTINFIFNDAQLKLIARRTLDGNQPSEEELS